MNRRELIYRTACACAFIEAGSHLGLSAAKARTLRAYGCNIPPSEATSVRRIDDTSRSTFDFSKAQVLRSSGWNEFDGALKPILANIAELFEVNPSFEYYDDENKLNARAGESKYPGLDGTVLFGINYFREIMAVTGGDIAIIMISSHEYAHVYQEKYGYIGKIIEKCPGYCVELHADALAGWYMAEFKKENSSVSLYDAGNIILDYTKSHFNMRGTHGTKSQRRLAMNYGFDFANNNPNSSVGDVASSTFDNFLEHYR